ncbi:hypothetical protein [Streptomyces aureus]|uniref:RiboL-PSP-HEPN domain-containing protein n=1 Tax=Streptomyces aureus TaxID=193461 RepID=A0ABV4SZC3_9ACTN
MRRSWTGRDHGVNDLPGAAQIEKGLKLLDKKDVWRILATAIRPAFTPTNLKARLDEVSFRRNMIVHEADLTRLDRPQSVKREAIKGSSEVKADLDWLQSFIVLHQCTGHPVTGPCSLR